SCSSSRMRTAGQCLMGSFQCRYGLLARDAREIVKEFVEAVTPFEIIDEVSQRHAGSNKHGRSAEDFRVAVNNRRELHDQPLYGARPRLQAQEASWKMTPSVKRWPERSRLTPCRIVTR